MYVGHLQLFIIARQLESRVQASWSHDVQPCACWSAHRAMVKRDDTGVSTIPSTQALDLGLTGRQAAYTAGRDNRKAETALLGLACNDRLTCRTHMPKVLPRILGVSL